MKKIIYPLVALALTGCVSDEGNYIYQTLNEVKITDMQTSFEVLSKIDKLQIQPVVSGTLTGEDDSKFEYEWYVCGDRHKHTTISKEKNLDWLVDLPAGSHYIYFVVKDKTTGMDKRQSVSVNVKTPYSTGFLILGDLPGENKMGLDMLTMPAGRDTTLVENAFDNSELQLKSADKIIFLGQHYDPAQQFLWLMSDDKGYSLTSGASFENMGEFNDLGIVELDIAHKTPMKLVEVFPHQGRANRSRSYRGYMTEDVVVYNMVIGGQYYTQPVNRYSAASNDLFKPFPWVFSYGAYSSATAQLIYDMDADRFARMPTGFTYYCSYPTDYANDPWKFNAATEKRTLLYGENGYESGKGYCYAIMKDKGGDTRYIYRWLLGTSATAAITKSPLYTVDTSLAVDFDKASHYMFSSNRTSVLYSVGNRLYQYDYARGLVTYKDFDGEITCLEAEFCSKGSISEFFVCTWSDSAKGMIYKMNVPNDPNKVEFEMLPGQQWPTRLRVKDIEWKNAT